MKPRSVSAWVKHGCPEFLFSGGAKTKNKSSINDMKRVFVSADDRSWQLHWSWRLHQSCDL